MKLSKNWLRDYVALDRSDSEIESALTLIGFEVEGVETTGVPPMENLVVGEVLSKEPHPNADRLGVCSVNVGKDEPATIVCGATNYKVGDRVPVALPGCVLPGDFKIKKSKLRGVKSEGMMCSARELGLGNDHEGLLILDQRPEVGTPINEVFKDSDTVFDIEVTPNRPDCLSHLGIARELAAYFGLDFSYPEVTVKDVEQRQDPLVTSVKSEEPELCPYYSAYSIKNVKVGPSPEWMQKYLRAIGLRPINNIVDVTNYVLHELGQPLHAFDSSKIGGNQIIVRQASEGEKIVALDEKTYELKPQHLVIADAKKPIAIAGVMGGADTEVDASTTDIVLEAAYFNPSNIRLTSRRLGISSDSSYRFERGVDPKGVEFAALRAIELILDTAGGEVTGPALVDGEPPMIEREIRLLPDFVRERIGFHVEDADIRKVLVSLELPVAEFEETNEDTGQDRTVFRVGIPSFRLDLERPVDLVEEFLRIYGTDKIPSESVRNPGLPAEDDALAVFVRDSARLLAARGLNECVHYPMRSEHELRQWYTHAAADNLGLANPLASDQSHLRSGLLPGLLDAVRLNQARETTVRGLFETGRVFREFNGKVWELVSVAFVLLHDESQEWKAVPAPDFYDASALTRLILTEAGIDAPTREFKPITGEDPWQQGHAAHYGEPEKGYEAKFGLLSAAMLKNWDIRGSVVAGAVYILPDYLRKVAARSGYKTFSAFPPASRDIALVVDAATPAGQVESDLYRVASESTEGFELESVRVFDVYQGKGIPEDKKSLAFALRFRALDRTLTEKEVNQAFTAIQQKIQDGTGYTIRA